MSKGAAGVRVMFSKEADMTFWKARAEAEAKERKWRGREMDGLPHRASRPP
ncbi:hypothetical protein [Roseomonas sp. WA12]